MFNATIIADSLSPYNVRIITMQLCYPRFIHAEFMTHRVFSRNASSSRAIPVAKVIAEVRNNPAMPLHWGQNQPGMQADVEIEDKVRAEQLWRASANSAATYAEHMNMMGLHKQVVNRLLEPFQWMRVIVTSTEWDNFFELRDHRDAEPNIRHLAQLMRKAIDASTPRKLALTDWHLPYVGSGEKLVLADALKASAARCARVSYLTHEGRAPMLVDDLALFDRLAGGKPIHASPLEHQARAEDNTAFHRNLRGWKPFRQLWEETKEVGL